MTCETLFRLKYPEMENERADAAWKHLGPVFGSLQPIEVTRDMERRYIRTRDAAPSTIRVELSMLRASWNDAVRQRVLPPDALPVLDPLPPASPPRTRWLREEEAEKVISKAENWSSRAYLFCVIAAETAARRNAIQDLLWDQVDWATRVVHFLPDGAVQSRKRRASVPISDRLLPILRDAYKARRDEYVIGAGGMINGTIRRVGDAAGVPGVTPHVFRHTAATKMAQRGVPLWIIAQILGNTVEQVEKTYAKWQPGLGRDAINQISNG